MSRFTVRLCIFLGYIFKHYAVCVHGFRFLNIIRSHISGCIRNFSCFCCFCLHC